MQRRWTALNDSAEDSAGSLSGGFHYCLLMKTEPLFVTPAALKKEGRINNNKQRNNNNINGYDIKDDTFLLSFLQCVKVHHLNLKWE